MRYPNIICPRRRLLYAAADAFGVTVEDLRGTKRSARISTARHGAAYALRKKFGLSQSMIARMLAKDHSTIHYGQKSLEAKMRVWPELRAKVESILEEEL